MLTKTLSKIVKDAGYNYWMRFNDLRAGARRYKFMINGYYYSPAEYKKWDDEIKKQMRAAGIKFLSAGFEECWGGRCAYMAYIVKVPLTKE